MECDCNLCIDKILQYPITSYAYLVVSHYHSYDNYNTCSVYMQNGLEHESTLEGIDSAVFTFTDSVCITRDRMWCIPELSTSELLGYVCGLSSL